MSIISFTCLHYGSDYLPYALKQIYDCVDKILIVYSRRPSHGHSSAQVNPDTAEMCYEAAFRFGDPQNKIQWIEGEWGNEGAHRDMAVQLYPDADLIAVVDADEIWPTTDFAAITEWCLHQPNRTFKQKLRTPWRSFNFICDDEMKPDRFIRPKQIGSTYVPTELGYFYHFGYARAPSAIHYKLSCHGHKNELRPNWFENTFMKWSPFNNINDCHPTCVGFWNPKPFDKNLLPPLMRSHPYWDLDLIGDW